MDLSLHVSLDMVRIDMFDGTCGHMQVKVKR